MPSDHQLTGVVDGSVHCLRCHWSGWPDEVPPTCPFTASDALQEGREERSDYWASSQGRGADIFREPLYLTADEMDLLQFCVADSLGSMLVGTPVDRQNAQWRAQFEALTELGRKLGMEL